MVTDQKKKKKLKKSLNIDVSSNKGDHGLQSKANNNDNNVHKIKLFEFEFRTVFENRKCFPVFLDLAIQEFNSDIVIMFTHVEWFQALTPDRTELFEQFIVLSDKCASSVQLQGTKIKFLNEELERLGLQNHSYVTMMGFGTNHHHHQRASSSSSLSCPSPSKSSSSASPQPKTPRGGVNKFWNRSRQGSTSTSTFVGGGGTGSGTNSPVSPLSPASLQKAQDQLFSTTASHYNSARFSVRDQQIAEICNMCELYAHCASLIEVYVMTEANYEINISFTIRSDLISRWQEFIELYRQSIDVLMNQMNVKGLSTNLEAGTAETTTTAATDGDGDDTTESEFLLCDSALELKKQCGLLFQSCRLALEMTLSDDIFPRFKRCKQWAKFVQSCSMEELNEFGENKATASIDPLKLSREDMIRPMITPRDVALARVLLRDFYHWKPLKQKKKLSLYYSNISFLQGSALADHGHLNAYKTTYEFNTSAKNFMKMFLSKQYYTAISEMDVDCVAYIPMSVQKMNEKKNELNQSVPPTANNRSSSQGSGRGSRGSKGAFSQLRSGQQVNTHRMDQAIDDHKRVINYGSTVLYQKKITTLVKREFVQTSTVFYEPPTRTYYYVFKYCEHENLPEVIKGLVRGVSFGVASFTENAGKCRYSSVFMVNLKGLMASKGEKPGLLARSGVAYHTKGTIKKMEEYVEEASKVNFQLEDDLQIMRSLGEFMTEFDVVEE